MRRSSELMGAATGVMALASGALAVCPFVPGDVNGSGDVDVVDVKCAINTSLQVLTTPYATPPSCVAEMLYAVDVTCDAYADIVDVSALITLALTDALSPAIDTNADGCADTCALQPTEVGSPAPLWTLPDFQPKSAGFGSSYGLEAREGVTVVALLASW